VVFGLVTLAIAMVYYFAPDAEQDWVYITPGSMLATFLWLVISLVFKYYIAHFTSYTATYGIIGGAIVLMLWFYVSALAVLIGAEVNAEIEHASPYGKEPGEKVAGEKRRLGPAAERAWRQSKTAGTFRPALSAANCVVDDDLPPVSAAPPRQARFSDWLVTGLVVAEAALMTYGKLKRPARVRD